MWISKALLVTDHAKNTSRPLLLTIFLDVKFIPVIYQLDFTLEGICSYSSIYGNCFNKWYFVQYIVTWNNIDLQKTLFRQHVCLLESITCTGIPQFMLYQFFDGNINVHSSIFASLKTPQILLVRKSVYFIKCGWQQNKLLVFIRSPPIQNRLYCYCPCRCIVVIAISCTV